MLLFFLILSILSYQLVAQDTASEKTNEGAFKQQMTASKKRKRDSCSSKSTEPSKHTSIAKALIVKSAPTDQFVDDMQPPIDDHQQALTHKDAQICQLQQNLLRTHAQLRKSNELVDYLEKELPQKLFLSVATSNMLQYKDVVEKNKKLLAELKLRDKEIVQLKAKNTASENNLVLHHIEITHLRTQRDALKKELHVHAACPIRSSGSSSGSCIFTP